MEKERQITYKPGLETEEEEQEEEKAKKEEGEKMEGGEKMVTTTHCIYSLLPYHRPLIAAVRLLQCPK